MAFSYQVSYSTSANGPWTLFNTVTTTTDQVTGLNSGTAYYFQIIVTDTTTNIVSAPFINGPFSTTSTVAESPDGTFVTAPTQTIRSSQNPGQAAPSGGPFDTWTISGPPGPSCQVVRNSVTDTTTSAIIQLFYHNHFLYQNATNGSSFGTPGWWQWTGPGTGSNGWTDAPNPVPAGPQIAVITIPAQQTGKTFTVSGTLTGYTTAPSLQYNDNGGTFQSLPAGSTVSTTQFSFTHPAIGASSNAFVVNIQDPANAVTAHASATFSVQNPASVTLSDITLATSQFSSNSPIGTVVSPITVVTTPTNSFVPDASNGLTLTGTNASLFSIANNQNLIVNNASIAAGNYNFNIVASMTGAVGSPLSKAQQLTASSGPAVGPGASSSFVNVDFTNMMSPNGVANVVVHQEIFGAALAGEGNFSGSFGIMTNSNYQAKTRALNHTCIRSIAGPDHPDGNSFGPFISAVNAGVFPNDCKIIVGIEDSTNYQDIVRAWENNSNIKPYCYEYSNERDQGVYMAGFPNFVSQVHAVNSNLRCAGPASAGMITGFAQAVQNAGGTVITYHDYLYCGSDPTPSDDQACLARNSSGVERYAGNTTSMQNALNSTNPVVQDEWGIPCVPNGDSRISSSIGAAFFISGAMTLASKADPNKNPMWGTIWNNFSGGDTEYRMIDGNWNTAPHYYACQRINRRMVGNMVNSNAPNNMRAWATKNGVNFCVAIVNGNGSSQSGQVALSHWPFNASGNATINLWTYPSPGGVNVPGTTTTINVTAGMTPSITVPGHSCVILSST